MALYLFGMPQSRLSMIIWGKKIPGSDVSEPGFSPMKHKTSECGSDAWIAQCIQLSTRTRPETWGKIKRRSGPDETSAGQYFGATNNRCLFV